MGLMRKTTTVTERRGWWRAAMKAAGIAASLWAAFKLPGMLPPAYGVLLIAALASVAISVLTRYNPEETAAPAAGKAQLVGPAMVAGIGYATWVAFTALGQGMDSLSRMVLPGLVMISTVVPAWVAWAKLRNTNPTAWPVTVGDAVDAFADGSRVRAAVLGVALATSIGCLTSTGYTYALLAVPVTFLIPVAIGWKDARVRAETRVEFSAAFVGLLSGTAWTKPLEDAGRSPVTCAWDDDHVAPTRIKMPLPAKWASTGTIALETEVFARLIEHGEYVIRVELGSKRRVTATRVEPLPEMLVYDGRPAAKGTSVWLGTGKATREHAAASGSKGKINGEMLDVRWDLRTEPHGMAVGTTGSGKTQTVSLIMMQLALAGVKLVLIDPKKVEFTAWEDRPGVLKVATELPDIVESLVAGRAEMTRRYDELRAAGVNHIDLLPAADRPPRLLIVVDEVVELLSKSTTKSEESKEINELKAEAGDAIGSILQLGRAAGVHLLVCGQRVERALFSGTWQNNIAFKILHGRPEAIERTMIGINDVLADPGIKGRAVMRSLALPQTETQVAYLDLQQLDRWLPRGGLDPVAEVVKLSPEDLVPLRLTTVVHAPTPKTVKPAPVPADANDDGEHKPKFKFDRQEPLPAGEAGAALDAMIGLAGVKAQVRQLQATVQTAAARRGRNLGGKNAVAPHLLFVGPPGTGKTVTARIIASMLHDVGAISSGHLIEADRSSLIAGYIGHTAMAMDAAFQAAIGGVLFIDEAYSLVDQGNVGGFGSEAIATLLKRAEDMRGQVVVIMAGYPHEMDTLLDANPGLRSRFPDSGRITFEAYTDDELAEIYVSMVAGQDRFLADDAMDAITEVIAASDRGKDWGNGRSCREMVESACARADTRLHADGLASVSDIDLMTLTAEDVRGENDVIEPVQDGPQDGPQDAVMDILEGEVLEGEIVDDAPDVDELDDAWCVDFTDALIAKDKAADAA